MFNSRDCAAAYGKNLPSGRAPAAPFVGLLGNNRVDIAISERILCASAGKINYRTRSDFDKRRHMNIQMPVVIARKIRGFTSLKRRSPAPDKQECMDQLYIY